MTIQEAKDKLIAIALNEVGYVEGSNNWNKYSAEMNGCNAYGWNVQNQPYCDIFADWCYYKAFGLDVAARLTYQPKGGFSALCSASANYYKNNGAWFSTPAVGDQVFFNVSGGINHTGIVVGVTGGVVTCVEGNSSDAVRKNNYNLGISYIAGFGRPNWDIFTSNLPTTPVADENTSTPAPEPEPPKQETCEVTVTLPVIEYGDASMWVKLMQTALICRGFNCGWYGADGEYGQQTKIALFQFQQKNGLEADNICGRATWKKLLEA